MHELVALVPALDCESTIGEVVRGALRRLPRVVVVDDGSGDRTADAAKAAGAEVLRHARTRGKAAALRTGFQALHADGASHALTLDGDGQHLPDEIPALRTAALAHPAALVIGARCLAPGTMTAMRRFGNRFANRWVEIACGLALEDSQSGFRVYPLEATLALGCRAERFAFETEVLIRATRAGIAVVSVPVRVHNPPPGERVSHFRGVRDATRIVLTVIGLLLRR